MPSNPTSRRSLFLLVVFLLAPALLALFLPAWAAQIGVLARLALGVLCLPIAAWTYRAGRVKWAAVLVALVGLGLILTALAGYGFNGRPPLPGLFH